MEYRQPTIDGLGRVLALDELGPNDERIRVLQTYFAEYFGRKGGGKMSLSTRAWRLDDGAYFVRIDVDGLTIWALGVCNTVDSVCYVNRLETYTKPSLERTMRFLRAGRDAVSPDGRVLWTLIFLHKAPTASDWHNKLVRAYRPSLGSGEWVYFYCNQYSTPTVLSSSQVKFFV